MKCVYPLVSFLLMTTVLLAAPPAKKAPPAKPVPAEKSWLDTVKEKVAGSDDKKAVPPAKKTPTAVKKQAAPKPAAAPVKAAVKTGSPSAARTAPCFTADSGCSKDSE